MHYSLNFLFCLFLISSIPLLAHEEVTRVAILGESYNADNGNSGFNEEILKRLFTLIRQDKPSAVVFTGNMTLGLEKLHSETTISNVVESSPGLDQTMYNDLWPREGFEYNAINFTKKIEEFLSLKNKTLENIPFYPIFAQHEAFGSDSIEIAKKTFNLDNKAASASSLAYTFALENSFFVLFSTAFYDESSKKAINNISPELLVWLDNVLKENRKKYDYVFVVGNAPAFSTSAASGTYKGLDINMKERDDFWRTLVNNKVTAYFCSSEHLYDRTNRYGIWQIISGGAGAPLYKREYDKAFYHYVLLSIPKKKNLYPKVQIYDVQGNVNDEFELVPKHYPVYQLRISQAN